jgi:hypothetical protein
VNEYGSDGFINWMFVSDGFYSFMLVYVHIVQVLHYLLSRNLVFWNILDDLFFEILNLLIFFVDELGMLLDYLLYILIYFMQSILIDSRLLFALMQLILIIL